MSFCSNSTILRHQRCKDFVHRSSEKESEGLRDKMENKCNKVQFRRGGELGDLNYKYVMLEEGKILYCKITSWENIQLILHCCYMGCYDLLLCFTCRNQCTPPIFCFGFKTDKKYCTHTYTHPLITWVHVSKGSKTDISRNDIIAKSKDECLQCTSLDLGIVAEIKIQVPDKGSIVALILS